LNFSRIAKVNDFAVAVIIFRTLSCNPLVEIIAWRDINNYWRPDLDNGARELVLVIEGFTLWRNFTLDELNPDLGGLIRNEQISIIVKLDK
jgi:hypothetical protein